MGKRVPMENFVDKKNRRDFTKTQNPTKNQVLETIQKAKESAYSA